MTSVVGIYNMALAHIGQGETVSTITERSQAAMKCTMFYDACLEQVLEDFDWPFAKKTVYLAELGSPPPEWNYRYQYPVDCAKARFIVRTGMRVPPTADQRIPFEIAFGDSGNVILCDEYQARLAYTVKVTQTERFSGLFTDALSYLLASKIAMPLSAKKEDADRALQMYGQSIQRAQVHAFEEGQEDVPPLPEFVRARY